MPAIHALLALSTIARIRIQANLAEVIDRGQQVLGLGAGVYVCAIVGLSCLILTSRLSNIRRIPYALKIFLFLNNY